jgi:hypothetical protein
MPPRGVTRMTRCRRAFMRPPPCRHAGGFSLLARPGARTGVRPVWRLRDRTGQFRAANMPSRSRLVGATTRAGLWLWAGRPQDRRPRSMVAFEARIRAEMLQGSGKDRSRAPAAAASRRFARALTGERRPADATIRRAVAQSLSHFFAPLDQHSGHAVKFG